jgi:hypothetical protein
MKLTRIESREVYPVHERPHYRISLSKRTADFYLGGKDMPDDETGNVIIRLINALNAAEKQIDFLFTVIQNAEVHKDEFDEYLEDYPSEEDYTHKYKLQDLKDALFHAMMRKDEKQISHYINKINIVQEMEGKENG